MNFIVVVNVSKHQGGRTWQPFVRGKSGHDNFRQARIHDFRDKCVVFARNRKFANLIQYKMQYLPCNRALLAQETLRTTSATLAGTTHVE